MRRRRKILLLAFLVLFLSLCLALDLKAGEENALTSALSTLRQKEKNLVLDCDFFSEVARQCIEDGNKEACSYLLRPEIKQKVVKVLEEKNVGKAYSEPMAYSCSSFEFCLYNPCLYAYAKLITSGNKKVVAQYYDTKVTNFVYQKMVELGEEGLAASVKRVLVAKLIQKHTDLKELVKDCLRGGDDIACRAGAEIAKRQGDERTAYRLYHELCSYKDPDSCMWAVFYYAKIEKLHWLYQFLKKYSGSFDYGDTRFAQEVARAKAYTIRYSDIYAATTPPELRSSYFSIRYSPGSCDFTIVYAPFSFSLNNTIIAQAKGTGVKITPNYDMVPIFLKWLTKKIPRDFYIYRFRGYGKEYREEWRREWRELAKEGRANWKDYLYGMQSARRMDRGTAWKEWIECPKNIFLTGVMVARAVQDDPSLVNEIVRDFIKEKFCKGGKR